MAVSAEFCREFKRREKCRGCGHVRHDHVPHSEGGTYCWSRDSVDGMWCECTEFKEVGQ